MNSKGSASAWLTTLIIILTLGFLFTVFSQVFIGTIVPFTETSLNSATYPNGTAVNVTSTLDNINLIKLIWNAWPLVSLLGLIVAGFVAAQRRDPGQY